MAGRWNKASYCVNVVHNELWHVACGWVDKQLSFHHDVHDNDERMISSTFDQLLLQTLDRCGNGDIYDRHDRGDFLVCDGLARGNKMRHWIPNDQTRETHILDKTLGDEDDDSVEIVLGDRSNLEALEILYKD